MNFNQKSLTKNKYMLNGSLKKNGYDWWWHSFTARDEETGEEKPFFIEFFIVNPALAEDTPTLGQLPSNKEAKKKPSYLMINVGTWGEDAVQLHRFISMKDVKVKKGKDFSVTAFDCYLDEHNVKGKVEVKDAEKHPEYLCDNGVMEFDLKIEKDVAFNVGYGTRAMFRETKAFEMYWHAEGMKSFFEGSITFNGKKYKVSKENCYGYSDKNWGKDFTSPWVWLSSNNLVSNITKKQLTNSVFDIGGGRPKVLGIALERKLLGAFWYEGTPYEFNFSKFWTRTKTIFDCKETDTQIVWDVTQTNRKFKMVTHITCEKKDMIKIKYEAPNGKMLHKNLWNGGNGKGNIKLYRLKDNALIDDIDCFNVGCEYGEYSKE